MTTNPNVEWSQIFVDSLAKSGLTAVSISPGSRSTPLTLAFHAHQAIEVHLHLDERSAGFFALGMALATGKPAALVCTSGTAAANFLPAIIEAKMSQVPLLVLTADRPHELRHSGANQTIDQVKIYGSQVLWSVDAALPSSGAPEAAVRSHQALAARAYATANGLVKGPVHVNLPFRKPLEPEKIDDQRLKIDARRFPVNHQSLIFSLQIQHGRIHPTDEQLDALMAVLSQHPRGLIICGPRCPKGDFPHVLRQLAYQTGYPILADPLSGLRFNRRDVEDVEKKSTKSVQSADNLIIGGYETFSQAEKKSAESVQSADNLIIGGYETFLQNEPNWAEPEIIVRFGAVPTSKWLNNYLDHINPAQRIHIRANGVWADESHRTTWFLQADETETCRQLASRLQPRPISNWARQIVAIEAETWQKIDAAMENTYFDGAVVAAVIKNLPDDSVLFIGSSLPVRHLDQWARPYPKTIGLFGNRGASGIDGNIAAGLGVAAAAQRPTFILIGDITAYHDLNSLLKARDMGSVTIIVINNNGGGIFRRLPVSQHEPPFIDLFLTPHGLNFEHAAQMFDLDYARVQDRETFRAVLHQSSASPRIIEVVTNGRSDYETQQRILKSILTGQRQ